MKTYTYSLLTLLMATLLLTSCLGDDKVVEYSDNCNISAFSLGSVRMKHVVKGSKGQDSTYYTVYTASTFPMSINQRELTIENRDSLPYGSLVNRVLTNCTFESVLVHRPQDISGVEPTDTAWVTYSNKDSIDFTKPRTFWVIAADGIAMRKYTVKVNVRQMDPTATVWDSLEVASLPGLNQGTVRRMAVVGDRLACLNLQADGSLTCFRRALEKQAEWEPVTVSGADGLVLTTLQASDDMLYASTTDGKVLYSTDGMEWRNRMNGMDGLQLAGVSQNRFYALVGGKMMSTDKSGEDWKEEATDESAELLPATDLAMVQMSQKNGNQRLLLTGKSADGKACVWSKNWLGDAEAESGWTYYSTNEAMKSPFPSLKESNMMAYGNGVLAFGGAPLVKTENTVDKPMGRLYYSPDYGITWKKHETMTLDERLTAGAANAQFITAASQDGRFVWLLVDGQLWRGRLNSVAFK